MKRLIVGLVLLGAFASPAAAQMPKYRVTVTVDKKADFSAIKTYAWTTGWSAYDPDVDRDIVAAVDRELQALGLDKLESGPSDVVVTYAALKRTDVDLKAKHSKAGTYPQFPVGTLVVLMLEPDSHRELFRARADKRLDVDPALIGKTIAGTVAEMFEKYPTRDKDARSTVR